MPLFQLPVDYTAGKVVYIRKFDYRQVWDELRDYGDFQEDLGKRIKPHPAVAISSRVYTPLYTTEPWGSMSGLVYGSDTDVAAAYKYHAETSRLKNQYGDDRYATCEDQGGNVHAQEELHAKFVEWYYRGVDKNKYHHHTKDLLKSFYEYVSVSPEAAWRYDLFKQYLMSQWEFPEALADAHLASVKHKYAKYFIDAPGDDVDPFPEEGLEPRRRRTDPCHIFADINEVLLRPTFKDVAGVYVNPRAIGEAVAIYVRYYKQTGHHLPCYQYDVGPGLTVDYDTALLCAAAVGDQARVESLLVEGARFDRVTPSGTTALMEAAKVGLDGLLEYLLAQPGVDINAKDENGSTALMFTASNDHYDTVLRLLDQPGLSLFDENGAGRDAFEIARHRGHDNVIDRLKPHFIRAYLGQLVASPESAATIQKNLRCHNVKIWEVENYLRGLPDGDTHKQLLFDTLSTVRREDSAILYHAYLRVQEALAPKPAPAPAPVQRVVDHSMFRPAPPPPVEEGWLSWAMSWFTA